MLILEKAKKEVVALLQAQMPKGVSLTVEQLENPPNRELGDIAFPCFTLARELKKSPAAIAVDITDALEPKGLIAAISHAGPYVNFSFDRKAFATAVIKEVAKADNCYGMAKSTKKTIMLEYAQPNTHKEVHVGHLRNFVLGLSIQRLLEAAGNKIIPVAYIGDVGAHIAKALWAYRTFHPNEAVPEDVGKYFGAIYTEATQKLEANEDLKSEVDALQTILEEGSDPTLNKLWEETVKACLDEMREVFTELDMKFEKIYTESEVEQRGKELTKELLEKGIAEVGERDALIVNLEDEDLGVFLILKGDGNSLYATKELALAEKKFEEYPEVDKSLIVVDMRQSHYFNQFFATLKQMGFKQDMAHIAYGLVTLKEGAMSSRKGNIATYADFRDEMLSKVTEETKKRHIDWSDGKIKESAWAIAEGAMKFGMLKQDSDGPIVYDITAALSFEGFTGPYVQYAHARMTSILMKADADIPKTAKGSEDIGEYRLLRLIADFPQVSANAARELRPSLVAQYVFDLAQATSEFYRDVPVLKSEGEDRVRRLVIVQTAQAVLARGLHLLGMKAPKVM